MKSIVTAVLIFGLFTNSVVSQPFAKWTKTELTLNNGIVQRVIKLPSPTGNFLTTSYKPLTGEFKYFQPTNTDFQFEINGAVYSGNTDWSLIELKSISDLVIGNPRMDDKGWKMHIKSLAGALPIMLGDPRKLNSEDLKRYRAYADWLHLMQNKYDIMSYRQDLNGFWEPKEGSWDGFQRINSETHSGGIVGIFKQGSKESHRMVIVQYLDPNAVYLIKSAPDSKQIAKMSGKELLEKGFEVVLNKNYDGALYEIIKL